MIKVLTITPGPSDYFEAKRSRKTGMTTVAVASVFGDRFEIAMKHAEQFDALALAATDAARMVRAGRTTKEKTT